MNATSQVVVNPAMLDLTVLDSASEVDDHVVPRRVRRLRVMGTKPTQPHEHLEIGVAHRSLFIEQRDNHSQ